jgi:hypothetical protein
MLKVDVHRPIGEEDIEVPCESALIITLSKDESGKTDACRTIIAGQISFTDLMVMTRMMAEQVEDCARSQFDADTFNVVDMLQHVMAHRYVLENLNTEKVVAH